MKRPWTVALVLVATPLVCEPRLVSRFIGGSPSCCRSARDRALERACAESPSRDGIQVAAAPKGCCSAAVAETKSCCADRGAAPPADESSAGSVASRTCCPVPCSQCPCCVGPPVPAISLPPPPLALYGEPVEEPICLKDVHIDRRFDEPAIPPPILV